MKVQILFTALVMLLAYLSEAQGKCWRFGHMCWGGHGKRSGGKALVNPPSNTFTTSAPGPVHHRHRKDQVDFKDAEVGAAAAPPGGDLQEEERLEYDAELLALPSIEVEADGDYFDDDVRSKEVKAEVVPMDDSVTSDEIYYKSYRASPKFRSENTGLSSSDVVVSPTEKSVENADLIEDGEVILADFLDANMDQSVPRNGGISQEQVFEAPPEEETAATLLFIRMPKRMKENNVATATAETTKNKMNRSIERSRRRKWIKAQVAK